MKKLKGVFEENRIPSAVLLFMVVLSGILCVFSFSKGIKWYDVYDYCEGVFWAEATLKAKWPIDPEYVYYYIVPFGSNLLMAPFVSLFGVSMLANQLGMLIFLLLCLAVLYRLSASFYPEKKHRFIFCAVASLFVFTYVGDNLLHHLLSYGIGYLCFLGELFCVLDIRKGKRRSFVLLVVFCLWSSANGIASAALSTVPVFAGILICDLHNGSLQKKENLKLYFSIAAATLAGLLVYKYFDLTATSLHRYNSRFTFTTPGAMLHNLTHDIFVDYLKLFYCDSFSGPVFSFRGAFYLLKLLFALASVVLPFVLLIYNNTNIEFSGQEKEDRFLLSVSSVFVILVCIAQYTLFKGSIFRYLFNGVLSAFLLSALSFTDLVRYSGKRCGTVLLLIFILFFTYKTAFHTLPAGEEKKARYDRINEVLLDHGLSYGYTTRRDYKINELLSDGKIRNSNIEFDEADGRFYVSFDRIFLNELKKPQDIDRFYVLKHSAFDSNNPADILLEDTYSEKVTVSDVIIYIYPIEDWNLIMEER